jgi:hypothetical protein
VHGAFGNGGLSLRLEQQVHEHLVAVIGEALLELVAVAKLAAFGRPRDQRHIGEIGGEIFAPALRRHLGQIRADIFFRDRDVDRLDVGSVHPRDHLIAVLRCGAHSGGQRQRERREQRAACEREQTSPHERTQRRMHGSILGLGNGFARRMRPDTRATDMAWQWPKSGRAQRNPAIDKGRTPSYLSRIPAATRKSVVL